LAAGRPHDQAARFIDGVEYPLDGCAAASDCDRLSKAGRPLQPAPPDFAKTPAIVPDSAEFRPGVRQDSEQFLRADMDPEPRLQCEPGGKAQRCSDGGRYVDYLEDAAGEVTTRRDPWPMPSSASGGLLGSYKPHRSALAVAGARHRFGVGRADAVKGSEPVTG